MAYKKTALDELDEVYAANRGEWRRWLRKNHTKSPGIWLVYFKQGTGKPSVTYAEAVEEALCFGWIDSKVQKLDDQRYRQVYTPRKPKSVWSALNKRRIASMIEQKLMTGAGLKAIEIARANGSWESLDRVEALEMPEDFSAALDANTQAKANFAKLSPGYRKLVFYRINGAKTEPTRAKRVAEAVQMLAENRKPGMAPAAPR